MFKLNNEFHRHWPLITALSILWAITIYFLIVSINLNHGHFVYALDDPYIHMSIAKNFALHGVWGVSQYSFSSASTSLLWTLLLSIIYFFTGANIYIPFILNIILSTITVVMVYYIVRSFKLLPVYNLMILLCVIFFAPLPFLIFTGMETILQIILVVAFIYLSVQKLTNENSTIPNYYLILLAIPLVMVRYESLIIISIIAILLLVKKKYTFSFSLLGVAILPLTIFGVISILNGGTFLPNSLILKSTFTNTFYTTSLINLPIAIYSIIQSSEIFNIIIDPSITIYGLLVLSIAAFRLMKKRTIWDAPTLWLIIPGLTIFVQFIFTTNDYALRYASYLFVLGIIAIIIGVYDYLPKSLSFKLNRKSMPKYYLIVFVLILLFSPFTVNSYYSPILPQGINTKLYYLSNTPEATNGIYEQQYQMALFLGKYYPNNSIAANDIGAINYFNNNIKCLDLVGLGSNDVAQAREHNNFNEQEVNNLTNQHHAEIAIIYDSWFIGDIPPNWIKVGEWTTPHDVIAANDTISFYATSPQYEADLIENLKSFSPQLPKDVIQNGIYTQT